MFVYSDVKSPGSTWELHLILASLSLVEGGRIPGVAVKCVEIWRNTGGEGGPVEGGRIPGVAVKCVEIWRNTGGEVGHLDED